MTYNVIVVIDDDTKQETKGSVKMRKEMYGELINMGYSPDEAWEQISEMDFAEDYE